MFNNGSGWNEQSLYRTFHRCFLPSFGSFGQAVSEEKISKNLPIRNKNRLWRPCLLMDRDEMSNLYRGPSIEASYQISDQLALRFQRRRLKCEKLTDNRRRTPSDGKSSHCLWQGELKSRLVHNLFHYGVWTMNWSSTGFFLTMCLDNIFLLFTNLRQNSQMYNFGSLQNSTSPYIQ
jgi:hypothetical protein